MIIGIIILTSTIISYLLLKYGNVKKDGFVDVWFETSVVVSIFYGCFFITIPCITYLGVEEHKRFEVEFNEAVKQGHEGLLYNEAVKKNILLSKYQKLNEGLWDVFIYDEVSELSPIRINK